MSNSNEEDRTITVLWQEPPRRSLWQHLQEEQISKRIDGAHWVTA